MTNAPQHEIGKYRIIANLASGSQGTVYRAHDPTLGREVALKVLHPHLATPDIIERFRREGRIVASISHPNIAGISEIGEHNGVHFIAIEYVPHAASELVGRGAMDAVHAASIAYQTALALEAARVSRHGITHHDVKPDNLLLTSLDAGGMVKLVDFGIAHAGGMTSMTQAGSRWGTPFYMPPEQWAGERGDTRSDVYSLGVVMYQMLAGRVPFDSDSENELANQNAIANQHLAAAPAPLRAIRADVPEALEAVVAKCMAKSPAERYQTPGELAASLAAMLGIAAPGATAAAAVPRAPVQTSPEPTATRADARQAASSAPRPYQAASSAPRPYQPRGQSPPILRKRAPLLAAAAGIAAAFLAIVTLIVIMASQSGDDRPPQPPLPPRAIAVAPPDTPTAAPAPSVASASTPRPAPAPTATPTPAVSAADFIRAALADPSPTPTPTHTPTPTPTATPTPTGPIAFVSDRDGNDEIYAMNADGSGLARLTNNSAADHAPSWSPDGRRIAFRSRRDGNREIYAMNADGSGVTNLTNNSDADRYPSWSPDGRRIAFDSDRDGNWEIYAMNADGSGAARLTNNSARDWYPSWSPDGRRIAFNSDRDGNFEIYSMNADGSGLARLTNNPANDYHPSWSPDGRRIAFNSYRDGNYEIYAMNADGSGLARLTNNPADDSHPSWGPSTARVGSGVPAPQPTSDDHGDSRSSATGIYDGAGVNGVIGTSSDADYFSFQAERGRRYTMETTIQSGSDLDTLIWIYDASGSTLGADDDGGDGYASKIEWTAPSSATYYVIVRGGNTTGSYRLSLSSESSDDHGDSRSSATRISDGDSANGVIGTADDEDYFSFQAERGRRYTIETTIPSSSDVDTVIRLYDASGSRLEEDDDGGAGRASKIVWTAPSSATYYVKVNDYGGGSTGGYRLSLSAEPADDHGDSRSSATGISDGDGANGVIGTADDEDYFSFQAERGWRYTIETTIPSSSGVDTVIRLYGASGSRLEEDDDGGAGRASKIEWTAPSSATYYVKVNDHGGGSTGGYRLSLSSRAPADDHGDSRSSATRISDGDGANGVIGTADDSDYFSFQAERGWVYTIETTIPSDSDLDTVIRLYDASGSTLGVDDDGGDGYASKIEWTAPSSATYYVEVDRAGVSTGGYRLSLSADDHGDSRSSATGISDGDGANGVIGMADDADYFSFQAERGRRYTIETSIPSASDVDTFISLYDANGSTLEEDDDGGAGRASKIVWTAPSSATYYVEVDGLGDSTGGYRLSLSAEPADDHGDSRSSATGISVGSRANGVIGTADDADYFSFQAERGRRYTIETSIPSGSGVDTVISLYDASGSRLKRDDDDGVGRASKIVWTASSSATYYVEVDGLSRSTGGYWLSLSAEPADDHGDSRSSATGISVGSRANGVIGTADDADYFSFQARRGRRYTIETSIPSGSGVDTVITLYDASGSRLERDDDGGAGFASKIVWTAPSSATYYVKVEDYEVSTGGYRLSLSSR